LAAEKSGAVAEIFTSVMNFWGLLQQIRGWESWYNLKTLGQRLHI
jgi:hypothetical protein